MAITGLCCGNLLGGIGIGLMLAYILLRREQEFTRRMINMVKDQMEQQVLELNESWSEFVHSVLDIPDSGKSVDEVIK